MVYTIISNKGFFMARVLSQDIICATYNIQSFIINLIPCLTVYKTTDVSFLKIMVLLIAFSGYTMMF